MSSIPVEFSEKAITAGSENAATPYRDFIRSREPYRSLLEANPWMAAPKSGEPLAWGEGRYYDTTVARKHPYWKDISLPQPTKDIAQLRSDLHEWGYCLIEEALSAEQNQLIYHRVVDQAQDRKSVV